MLYVTRKIGEALEIGDGIKIIVKHCRAGRVHLGIEAPKDVPIRRISRPSHDPDLTEEAPPD